MVAVVQSCVNSGKLYIYGQRESKWDPYATKSKHHPSGSYDKPEDVWNSNKELIKKKAKKNKGLQRKVWIQKVKEWHNQGQPDLGWGGTAPGSI